MLRRRVRFQAVSDIDDAFRPSLIIHPHISGLFVLLKEEEEEEEEGF